MPSYCVLVLGVRGGLPLLRIALRVSHSLSGIFFIWQSHLDLFPVVCIPCADAVSLLRC
jgi:hypothetical protein